MAKQINIAILTTLDPRGAKAAQQWIAQLTQATKQAGAPKSGAPPFKATADSAARAEKDILRYTTAMASAQRATGDAAGAVATWRAALAQMTPNTIEAHQATTRLSQAQAALQKELAGGSNYARQFGQAAKDSLLSVLGPAAAVGAAYTAATGIVRSFAEAFVFKAELDATTASINAQLKGVRDTSVVYAEAARFANTYKLTQQETTEAIAASIGVMRNSKAGVEDILGVLARLQVLSPEQSLQEAAVAVKALASGDTTSLVTRFEVGRDVATQMKNEIQGGADAVAVMSKFLDDTGIGMDALAAKTEGAAGAIKDLAIAQENVKKAQGEIATSDLGVAAVQQYATVNQGLANVLSANIQITKESQHAAEMYNAVIAAASGNIQPLINATIADADAKRQQAAAGTVVAAAMPAVVTATQSAAVASGDLTSGIYNQIAATQVLNQLTQQATAAQLAQAESSEMAGIQARAAAMAAEMKSQADQVAAVDAQTHAVAMQDLHAQAQAAAAGLMASGSQGAASAAQLANSSSLIDILTAAYYRLAAAQAAAGQATTNRAALGDQRAGERSGGKVRTLQAEIGLANRQSDIQRAQARTAQEQLQADLAIARAKGDQKTQIDLLRRSQQGLIAGSAEYKQIEASILSLQKSGGGAGGSRGGGASKAAKAAEATSTKLADIARTGGQKLEDIEEQTQSKLLAIDEKYAEQRAEAQRDLNDEIARMSSGAAFDQQLNDFEQFGKDMSDEQKAAFAAREQAEVRYNERIRQAQEAARQEAVDGDATLAGDKLKIREAEAKRQMEIEQRAAQANIDTGGDQAAAIAQQAAEASAASQAQAATEIAIAEAKAAEKAGAQQAEKDAVIASANEQRDKVVSAAEDQASKVKGAADSQKSAVISALRAQADAAAEWARSIASSARSAQSAMGGVAGPPTGGEGGDTGGGEAPPAPEAPPGPGIRQGLSGGGRRSVGGGDSLSGAISTLNDAAEIIKILKPFVAANKGAVKLLNEYKITVESAIGSLLAIQRLRQQLVMPAPPLDPAQVLQLKADLEFVLNTMVFIDASATKKVRVFAKYLETEKSAIEILTQAQQLRRDLASPSPPIDPAYIMALLADANQVVTLLSSAFIPLKQRQVDDLKRYAEAEGASVAILNSMADLRERLSAPQPPFDVNYLVKLFREAAGLVGYLQTVLLPITEQQGAEIERYAAAVSATVDALSAVNDLHENLAEPQPPITAHQVITLGREAVGIVQFMQGIIIPLTEEQAALFERFGSSAGAAIQALNDVAGLHETLAEPHPPITAERVKALAAEVKHVTAIFLASIIPTTEEQANAAQYYADRAGAAVQVLSDVAGLREDMTDLAAPIPIARIQGLAGEAKRIAQVVYGLLIPTTEEDAAAFSDYGDSVSTAVGIISDVAGLRKDALDIAPPIPLARIRGLAGEALHITQIVRGLLVPTSEEQAAGFSRYAEAEGAAVGILRDVVGLRKDATDLAPPLSVAQITRLADDAKRITQIVMARMVPASEEQAAAAQRFADTTGSAVSAISDVLSLPAKMFTDYQSPSDAQINRVVADANRIVQGVNRAAKAYDTKGLEAAQAFGDATGSIIAAFRDQLLFSQAIGSGDFTLDTAKLAVFEKGMAQTLAVAGRLGAQAVAIPAGNIAALQNTTAALTAAYESMIRLSAVPFGNLPQLAQGFGAAVGGTNITVNINNPPANLNVPGLIGQVKQAVVQSLAGKH
jgi:hypothetical protein